MHRLICFFAISSLAFTCTPTYAAEIGGGAGSSSGTGGAAGGVIWAGVQFGRPPASLSSRDSNGCTWRPATVHDAGLGDSGTITRVTNGITYRLYYRSCPSGGALVWIPESSPPNLALQAANTIYSRLPTPRPGVAPPAHAGVVNVGMWYWTDPATWRSVSVTAWVPTPTGILWATTTARPVSLVFTPGDGSLGSGPASCTGPGTRWTAQHGDTTASSCMYTYRHSSAMHATGRYPASLGIVWQVSWTSNAGRGGSLPAHTTTASLPITVDEIQALVTG